jgi:hypothetical protein
MQKYVETQMAGNKGHIDAFDLNARELSQKLVEVATFHSFP